MESRKKNVVKINAKLKLLLFCVAVQVCDMHRREDAKSEGIWTDAKLKVLLFCVPVQVCDMHRHGVAKAEGTWIDTKLNSSSSVFLSSCSTTMGTQRSPLLAIST